MQVKLEWKWEHLDECTQRTKVKGGWLILRLGAIDIEKNKRVSFRETMIFLPDPDHQWTILPPPIDEIAAKTELAKGFAPK